MGQRIVAWIGAFVTLGLFALTWAKRLADAISIIHLPHDVGEFLTAMAETPLIISYVALAIGIYCLIYLAHHSWRERKAPAIPNGKTAELVFDINIQVQGTRNQYLELHATSAINAEGLSIWVEYFENLKPLIALVGSVKPEVGLHLNFRLTNITARDEAGNFVCWGEARAELRNRIKLGRNQARLVFESGGRKQYYPFFVDRSDNDEAYVFLRVQKDDGMPTWPTH